MGRRILVGLGILVLILVAGGGGFFYGVSVGEARASQAREQFAGERIRGQGGEFAGPVRAPEPGQEGGARLGAGTLGTIEAIEGDVLIVSTQEGTVQVLTSDTTLIQKTMSVGVEELETGEQVMISGSRNADGSITARSIQSPRASQFPRPE